MKKNQEEQQERRQHKRFPANGTLKVYTSVSNIAYSVEIKDISRSGARIHTKHLPQAGEEITFHILDDYGIKQYTGQGQVVWVLGSGSEEQLSFAVQFDQELTLVEENIAINRETQEA